MEMKMTLKSLCMSYGWSYGVFWRFDPHNHMVLTMEDAYFEEHTGSIINSMLLQAHVLGKGIVGEAAVSGKCRWMFVDEQCQAIDCTTMQILSLDDAELGLHTSSGIKTVAVVPVALRGVLQFGSTKEIAETREFLVQANHSFDGIALGHDNMTSLQQDASGQYELFGSLNSSLNSFYGDVSTPWTNTIENMAASSEFDLLDAPLGPCDEERRDHDGASELTVDPRFESLVQNTRDVFEESFESLRRNDLTQWFAESSKLRPTGFDDLSHTLGVDCTSSGLVGNDISSSSQGKAVAHSSESSLSNVSQSCQEEKPLVIANSVDLLAEYGMDIGSGKLAETVEDVTGTIGDVHHLMPIDTRSITEVDGHPVVASRKGLFSELGLEHLLNDRKGVNASVSYNSCIDDQWHSSKKRRFEAYEADNGRIQHANHSWEVKSADLTNNGGQMQDSGTMKECMPKSQAGLWINESYSMDSKSCISTSNVQRQNSVEPTKPTKKRAKPGESTRPRPKDRQMIADRIKELRDMIPNGAKLSIDALLSRTIKHMVFLQSLNKHADYLKEVGEPKGNRLVKEGDRRGATWAFEVGGTNMFCPIIVEDLGHPRHMLIEMLCEEQGYFLEIADIVRSFGLTILKGVMEERNDKVWAHFIVEGDRHITRMDVFVFLMQLLQGTAASEPKASAEPAKFVNNVDPLWGNYQQHVVPLPI